MPVFFHLALLVLVELSYRRNNVRCTFIIARANLVFDDSISFGAAYSLSTSMLSFVPRIFFALRFVISFLPQSSPPIEMLLLAVVSTYVSGSW